MQQIVIVLAGMPPWLINLSALIGLLLGVWAFLGGIVLGLRRLWHWLPQFSRWLARREANQLALKMRVYHTAISNSTLPALVGGLLLQAMGVAALVAVIPWVAYGQGGWLDHIAAFDKFHSPLFFYSYLSILCVVFAFMWHMALMVRYANPPNYSMTMAARIISLLRAAGNNTREEREAWLTEAKILPGYGAEVEFLEEALARHLAGLPPIAPS